MASSILRNPRPAKEPPPSSDPVELSQAEDPVPFRSAPATPTEYSTQIQCPGIPRMDSITPQNPIRAPHPM